MKMQDLLKKKYTKKKLKELLSYQRSQVGMNKNLSTIPLKSDKYYNRKKSKLDLKRWEKYGE